MPARQPAGARSACPAGKLRRRGLSSRPAPDAALHSVRGWSTSRARRYGGPWLVRKLRAPLAACGSPTAGAPLAQVRTFRAQGGVVAVPRVHPRRVREPVKEALGHVVEQQREVVRTICRRPAGSISRTVGGLAHAAGEAGLDREDMNPGASAPGVLLFRSSSASREHLFDGTRPDHRVCAGDRVSEVCLVRCSLRIGVPEAGRCLDQPPVDESSGTSA